MTDGVTVREARPEDGPALRTLQSMLDSPVPELLETALGGSLPCPVAVRKRPVGYALALTGGDTPAYLVELVVAPAVRRQGIGSRLLTAVRDRTAGPLRLTVRADDQRARAFYASHGGRPVERRTGHYTGGDGPVDGLVIELC